jgi:hypothetical protein
MFFNRFFLPYLFKFFLLVFLLFSALDLVYSQEPSSLESEFFREDQFYLGASFMLLQSAASEFQPQGLSRHFQWGFIRDLPLSSSGKLASGIGLGMSFERYTTNFTRLSQNLPVTQYTISAENNAPLFFTKHAFELPLTFRWRNATADDFAFWRVYGGVSLQWNYYNKIRQESIEIKNSNELQKFGTLAHLSFGYNTWNFYFAYQLSSFFDPTALTAESYALDLNPIKIGLIFYIL